MPPPPFKAVGEVPNNPKQASKQKEPRKCGFCKQPGHNRRNCPKNPNPKERKSAKKAAPVVHPAPVEPIAAPKHVPYDDNRTRRGLVVQGSGSNVAQKIAEDAAPSTPPPKNSLRTQLGTQPPALRSPLRRLGNENVLYFVFDVETTGFGHEADIVEIAMAVMSNSKRRLDGDGLFCMRAKPAKAIHPEASALHEMKAEHLAHEPLFEVVGKALIAFIEKFLQGNRKVGILVAHNAKFDVSVLLNSLKRNNLKLPDRVTMMCDSLKMAKEAFKRGGPETVIPHKCSLGSLYAFFFKKTLEKAHRATVDVEALIEIFCHKTMWIHRKSAREELSSFKPGKAGENVTRAMAEEDIAAIKNPYLSQHKVKGGKVPAVDAEGVSNNQQQMDLDVLSDGEELIEEDDEEDDGLDSDAEENAEGFADGLMAPEQPAQQPSSSTATPTLQEGWHVNLGFKGVNYKSHFEEFLKKRVEKQKAINKKIKEENKNKLKKGERTKPLRFDIAREPGLQGNPKSYDTPDRTWDKMYTKPIQMLVLKNTNIYGSWRFGDEWVDVTLEELERFNMVWFLASGRNRTDPHANWFSKDELINEPMIKRLFTGKRFSQILQALHLCPLDSPDYNDPAFKVREWYLKLEERYKACYEPGQHLSLDESLIRAYGRIKFKVRIVTKSARYGIKLYVLTCAKTGYVLKTIIYTGDTTDGYDDRDDKGKVLQVVRELLKDYRDTWRVVHIDRGYGGLDVSMALFNDGLHTNGTCMGNRVPPGVRMTKESVKDKERGYFEKHTYIWKDKNGKEQRVGLVCWKDKKPVLVLTTCGDCESIDDCVRRGKGGQLIITRPVVIEFYNENMGGVDLKDSRRLFAPIVIKGQHRWWIRLYATGLDETAHNAMVVTNLAYKALGRKEQFNLKDYKLELVRKKLGERLFSVPGSLSTPASGVKRSSIGAARDIKKLPEHRLVPMLVSEGKTRKTHCAYCKLVLKEETFVRSCCKGCNEAFCNEAVNGNECFHLVHEDEPTRRYYMEIFQKYSAKKRKHDQLTYYGEAGVVPQLGKKKKTS